MTIKPLIFAIILLIQLSTEAVESSKIQTTNLNQYRITLLRSAPGTFEKLIEDVKNYGSKTPLLTLRHSQGDHWDLMLIEPARSHPTRMHDFRALADFQHSFLTESISEWNALVAKSKISELYHIEMFQAIHGKVEKLYQERKMENQYLRATQQVDNDIFVTTFGTDMDMFTLGFHENLSSFAASPDLTKEAFEKAAVDSGFKNRADLSFYLRSLLLSHHDTLATKID